FDLPIGEQQAQAKVVHTAIVGCDGEVAHIHVPQRLDAQLGNSAQAESAGRNRCTVAYPLQRLDCTRTNLVHRLQLPLDIEARSARPAAPDFKRFYDIECVLSQLLARGGYANDAAACGNWQYGIDRRKRRSKDDTTMPDLSAQPTQLSAQEHRSHLRRAVVASTIGTAVEWYDFFLYSSVTGLVFARLFFPQSSPLTGTLQAFTVYLFGFVARPIGAAIFGHFGDRIGRKSTLILTLVLMGMATFLVGLVPTYATIG